MKYNLFKKATAVVLTIIMLMSCLLPTYAVENFGSFSGKVNASDKVALSNIEVQVYSATPVFDTQKNGELLYYAETYEFSVYTDRRGCFEFNKPSQFCSISVVLDSLPQGYGVSQQTQFIVPDNTTIEIDMSAVTAVNVVLIDGEIVPEMYNTYGDVVAATYTLIPSVGNVVYSAFNASSSALSLKSIDSVSAYNYTGKVIVGSKEFTYTVAESLENFSVLDKINILTSMGYLTEEEKISLYCDLLKNDDGYTIQSGTTILQEILKYQENNVVAAGSSLSRKIERVAATSTDPTYTDYIEATIGTYKIRVFYDVNEDMDYSVVSNFVSECISVYNYYVTTNGFLAPIPYDSTSYYPIYLVTDTYLSANGSTTYNPESLNQSKICVRYSRAAGSRDQYAVTLAHEFNHAVMAAYGCSGADKWFKESFTSMMALIYYGSSTSWYEYYVPEYLTRSYCSITNTTYSGIMYGALMYPLHIYTNLGGIRAIRSIYEAYEDAGNGFDAITNSPFISDYSYAFLGSVSRNYKPTYYYTYATAAWGTGKITDLVFPYAGSTTLGINSMACHYYRFSSATNIGTAYFTVEVVSSNSSGLMLNKITETSTGSLTISTVSTSFTRITIPQTNFGQTIKKLTVLPANTNRSGSAIRYKLSASN